MIKLMLNTHKINNYAFFCPVSRLHLTVSSPVGYANEVTSAILRGLKAQTILDVDGVVNIEAGTAKTRTTKQEAKAPAQKPVQVETPEQKVEITQEAPVEAPAEEVAPVVEKAEAPVVETAEAPAEDAAEEKPVEAKKKGGKKSNKEADAQ